MIYTKPILPMSSKLTYPEVIEAYRRKLRQAEFKAASSVVPSTRKKYEGLACLYESTIYFLTNRITNKSL